MVTPIQDSELFAVCQHLLQANLALFIVFLNVCTLFLAVHKVSSVLARWVHIVTRIAVPAVATDEVLADHLLFIPLEKVLNQLLLVEIHQILLEVHLFAPDSLDDALLFVSVGIKNDFLVLLAILVFIIILEVVGLVVTLKHLITPAGLA